MWLVVCFGAALAQQPTPAPKTVPETKPGKPDAVVHPAPVPPTQPAAKTVVPAPVSLDLNAIDKSADPCVDFYQYACGGWLKTHPIPNDQSRWGRFSELNERNLFIEREILDDAAKPTAGRSAIEQEIGDY